MNSSDILEIGNTPIPIDQWAMNQVGLSNDGEYKKEYPNIEVRDIGEELVSLSEFGLVSSDFYMDEYLKGKTYLSEGIKNNLLYSHAFLRKGIVARLQAVDEVLRVNGYFLHIQSGWRHPKIQEIVKNEYSLHHGRESADKMFAPVLEGKAPPPHSTGGAFDLEIRSLKYGARQELYYIYKNKHIYGAYHSELLAKGHDDFVVDNLFNEVLFNRRLLYHLLCTKGVVFSNSEDLFCCHPGECWHFGFGDPLSAYLRQQEYAIYGLIKPKN